MKKFVFILIVLILISLPVVARAEETDRERLVRIETKLDIIIEQNKVLSSADKDMDTRITACQSKVDIIWYLLAGVTTITGGLAVKLSADWLASRQKKAGC
jgi:hypothetical protein